MAIKQPGKLRGGVTGKGFVKGDLRINRTKPGPGRPAEEFVNWCQAKLGNKKARAHVWKRAQESDTVLLRLMAYAYGQPPEKLEVSNDAPPGSVLLIGGDAGAYIRGLRQAREET